ncbi:DUF2240 family protein [Halodesulfurarchaeum sp.]|uniref:DUF2240 family protein n=1 Tax=Halodesulfurarchaeum sp. TaxID=1980530 RepID=UPI002FC29BCF
MSLRIAVAAPFKRAGREQLSEQSFVVDLAVERNWVSPDQAKRLVELGRKRGLLETAEDDLVAMFDVTSVTVPDGFMPDESLFQERSPVEIVIDALVEVGTDRRAAVASINTLQQELSVTAGTAAVLRARQVGRDVPEAVTGAKAELRS